MLILARQPDEVIVLDFSQATDAELLSLRDRPVRVMVTEIRPSADKVKLGVDAPKFVGVDRLETWKAKRVERGVGA